MRWAVAYYYGSLPLVWRDSESFSWSALPAGDGVSSGVAWVDVWDSGFHHRLSGFDYYWVDPSTRSFGVFNDPSNWRWYGGGPAKQYLAWRWTGVGSELIAPALALATAHVLNGVMLSDDDAREVGLLGPGESLAPRPT